jgi:outer membrane protein assembly factor BamB
MGAGHIGLTTMKSDGTTLWSTPSRDWEYLGRHAAVADVDGDGEPEVGALQASGLFVSVDAATGEQAWARQLPAAGSSVVTGNIDRKGTVDYVFGTNDGHLYALDGRPDVRKRVLWSLTLGAQIGDPALADVDSDGRSEVVFAAGDGYLYVVDGKKWHK